MKKLNLIGALLLSSVMVFAQDMESNTNSSESLSFTTKNGHEVLPQAGDWAIGLGASSAVAYFGNLFSDDNNYSGDNPFGFANTNLPTQVIFGKYMVSGELAYRGFARLSYNRVSTKSKVIADLNDDPDAYVTDKRVNTSSGITLGLGLEKRRGSKRLVGVYGAQAFVNFNQNQTSKMEYGNAFSLENPNPTRSSLAINTAAIDPTFGNRIVKSSFGSDFGIGAQAFIGAEYYFAPKMSIGGEFYWGLTYTKNPSSCETWEAWEPSSNSVVEYTSKTSGGSAFNAGLSNLGGAINLFLYF